MLLAIFKLKRVDQIKVLHIIVFYTNKIIFEILHSIASRIIVFKYLYINTLTRIIHNICTGINIFICHMKEQIGYIVVKACRDNLE